MSDSVQLLLWLLGVPAALAAVWLLIIGMEWAAWKVENTAVHLHGQLTGWKTHHTAIDRLDKDRQAFMHWLAARAGTEPMGSGVDESLVAAQQQIELIHVLLEEEIPKAVGRCCETHRLTAAVAGASHMSEIAYETDCYKLRATTAWLLAHAVSFLEAYPLRMDDSRLLHNSIVLKKRALPICRRCPFIRIPVDAAPTRCPTAELVQLNHGGALNGS